MASMSQAPTLMLTAPDAAAPRIAMVVRTTAAQMKRISVPLLGVVILLTGLSSAAAPAFAGKGRLCLHDLQSKGIPHAGRH